MLKQMAVFLLIVICAGCAQKVAVTYESDPYGASLYDNNGMNWGQTPVTLVYEPTKEDKKNGVMRLAPIRAQWISGASAVGPQLLNLQNGSSQTFKFFRPKDVPGQDKDSLYAIMTLQGEISSLDRQIQYSQQQQLVPQQQTVTPSLQQQNQQNQTHCNTKLVNGQLQTYCW